MKATKMLTIVVLALASTAHGAQSLIVHNQPVDVDSIMLKVGQDVVIKVASDNFDSYTAYVGFDNGVVLGNFWHMMSWAIAGDLRDVTDYNLPAFYGYYIVANGLIVTPSPGDHFIFVYKAQQTGETTLNPLLKQVENINHQDDNQDWKHLVYLFQGCLLMHLKEYLVNVLTSIVSDILTQLY